MDYIIHKESIGKIHDGNGVHAFVDRKTGVVSARENIRRNTKLTIKYAENMKNWGLYWEKGVNDKR